ncbi:MAG: TIR domain-containing protein [Candidatus Didemnitutus sp.]|nr:TIR domain-containing protein [Candidatus Didemnitutus sp.]
MSDSNKAVFLSYAQEDAAAATRIAEALRGFGVEVWFDQHELRGGDQWDAKIRGQIKACALFIPIISATTQSRDEAYFRLEWKLADDRSHLMAPGKAFVVPVVIDQSAEYGAAVPESFNRAQWTRLADGLPSTAFIEQVKKLLGGEKTVGAALRRASAEPSRHKAAPTTRPSWLVPLAAVVIVVAGYFGWQGTRPTTHPAAASSASDLPAPRSSLPASSSDKSIAVLPFANLSPDAENAFFTDGMHDDLITALAKIRDLKVISRTSVMPYKTGTRNLRKIAEDLGVATVLEGSVQRAGNRVRLNMQLIDARTDAHLWAETYNKELTDVFTIQAALTQEITTALKANFTNDERALIARRPTQNQAAYDLYLRARVLDQDISGGASRQEYERVIAFYEQAAAKDPAFALPHVQASILHGTMYWFAPLDATPARRALAQAAVEAAERLAPGAPETHMARGSFEYTCNNDWGKALAEYRAAETGLPNNAQLHYRIGLAHRRLGQLTAALDRFERSNTLNPGVVNEFSTLVDTLLSLRRYRQVIELCDRWEATFAADVRVESNRIRARLGLDGDRTAYLRGMAALPPAGTDLYGLDAAYQNALRVGDLTTAERVLEDPRLAVVVSGGGAINEPVVLHRALLAWLRGRPDDARRWADEAVVAIRQQKSAPRQEAWARMSLARADALAGRVDEALQGARLALDEQTARDVYASATMASEYGRVLLICGRREEALEVLREVVARPSQSSTATPGEIRFDPVWSLLKDDPRFEQILKSSKPL